MFSSLAGCVTPENYWGKGGRRGREQELRGEGEEKREESWG